MLEKLGNSLKELVTGEPALQPFDTSKDKPSLDRLIALPVSKLRDPSIALPLVIAASCNDRTTRNEYPLHRALEYDDVPDEIVLAILAAAPGIASIKTANDVLPLHHAAKRASPKVFAAIFEANPGAAKEVLRTGQYPLHILCEHNGREEQCASFVPKLLAECPDAAQHKLPENYGSALPLHLACTWANPAASVSALLAAYPAAANEKDKSGNVPLRYAKLAHGKQLDEPCDRPIPKLLEAAMK